MRSPLFGALLASALLAAVPLTSAAASSATMSMSRPTLAPLPAAFGAKPFRPDSAPLPESLSFVQFVSICPASGCGNRLCANDSIVVKVGGFLPDDCHSIRRVDVYYPPGVPVFGAPPWVRVIVDDGGCYGRPCIPGHIGWESHVTLPPQRPGPNTLRVSTIVVSCTDSVPPPPWQTSYFSFGVQDCDSIPPPPNQCLMHGWDRSNTHGACDAVVTKTQSAQVVMTLGAHVPLSGLQGQFLMWPRALQIVNIEPVGAAAGMRFTWAATDSGVRFLMFSDNGTTFPAASDGELQPALRVTVASTNRSPIPDVTYLEAFNLLGADTSGAAVPQCYILTLVYVPPARICGTPDCDYNHDHVSDVRDLVMMVRCLNGHDVCVAGYDCNGDGVWNLDDVLCCAWNILRGPPCVPPDSCGADTTAAGLHVGVSVGELIEAEDGVHVSIHVDGADRVGAARFAMRIPADRWQLGKIDASDNAWLTLSGIEDGKAVIGAIRISDAAGPASLDLTVVLKPIDGGGGTLGALESDVSTTDGVKVVVPEVPLERLLPGGPTVLLTANRPEPFSDKTRFELSLPAAAKSVDLAVFDLNGRRLATLHRGPLAAGVTEFAWNGHAEHGGQLGGGVYFYRAVVDGHAVSRRMVYLGSR